MRPVWLLATGGITLLAGALSLALAIPSAVFGGGLAAPFADQSLVVSASGTLTASVPLLVNPLAPSLSEESAPIDWVYDEFSSRELDPAWYWPRGAPVSWQVGGVPGQLAITTRPGDIYAGFNDASGILVRALPPGDMEFRTKLTFSPTGSFQQAGLILYQDSDTYMKLVRTRGPYLGGKVIDYIELTYELSGVPVTRILTTTNTSPYLRMRRQGGGVGGYWSADSVTWRLVGYFPDTFINSTKVGVLAFGGDGQTPGSNAVFDFFRADNLTSLSFDRFGVMSPSVLRLDDGTYRMWYAAYFDHDLETLMVAGSGSIGLATSLDGRTWTKVGAVLAGEGAPSRDLVVGDPVVIRDGGVYKMWFSGYQISSQGMRQGDIYLATSTDGITWTRQNRDRDGVLHPVVPVGGPSSFDDLDVRPGRVIKDGSTYRMWYTGRSQASQPGIGYATSVDGIAWTKIGQVIQNATSPRSLLSRDGVLRMYFVQNGAIQTATSLDGEVWSSVVPVLTFGPEGSWDQGRIDDPWALVEGSTTRLWYSGGPISRIGLAAGGPLAATLFLPAIVAGSHDFSSQ